MSMVAMDGVSDPEDVLDLLQDQHADHGHRKQETAEHEPEPESRPSACAPALDARRAPGAVVVVGARDRVWIVRRRLLNPAVRLVWDGRLLRMPLLGDLLGRLSNEKVRLKLLRSGIGAITETDVLLAA